MKFDGEYAKKLNFSLNVKILFLPIINVLSRSGVVEGEAGEMK